MLYNVASFLFLLLTVSADSINSFPRRLTTDKPDILLEDPLISKAINPPTHISEFTDPDTGLNPFLDLEEGPTFFGRNVMKDETREHSKEDNPPFMDFEMVEGDASDRRWKIELDFSKKKTEESVPIWIPFEEEHELKFEDEVTTSQFVTETDELTSLMTTVSDEKFLFDNEISEDIEQKFETELPIAIFSNVTTIYILMSIVILVVILFLLLGTWLWRRRKMARTSRVPTNENGELKC